MRDWVGVVEKIYESLQFDRPALTDAQWLQTVTDAFLPAVPEAIGTVAYTYDASDPGRFTFERPVVSGEPRLRAMVDFAMSTPLPPEYIAATYRSLRTSTVIESIPNGAPLKTSAEFKAMTGFGDVLIANGVNADGIGTWLGAGLDEYAPFDPELRALFERVSVHLSAAWRLRRRLAREARAATERAEAVLAPDGTVKDATGEAQHADAREELSHAVRALDALRTRAGRRDPAAALEEWRGLVARRWSLVEVYERDGKRYLLAQENEAAQPKGPELTPRESEVAGLAALGLSNKLVAYELGINPSTVGVLLHRAMTKLGTADRDALRALLLRSDAG